MLHQAIALTRTFNFAVTVVLEYFDFHANVKRCSYSILNTTLFLLGYNFQPVVSQFLLA